MEDEDQQMDGERLAEDAKETRLSYGSLVPLEPSSNAGELQDLFHEAAEWWVWLC